jgi:Zn finger protein HypA/HybF involved in hydrogenase expression
MKIDIVYKLLGCAALTNPLIAYGLSPFIPFLNTLCLLSAIAIILGSYFILIKPQLESVQDKQHTADEAEILNMFEKIAEQEDVIAEYESMLSEQVVELPCNCGKTLFEGILIPNAENMCKCPSCNSSYKVIIGYDSLLLTEELNSAQIFDNINKVQSENNDKTLE